MVAVLCPVPLLVRPVFLSPLSVLRNLPIVVDDPVARCARAAPSPAPPSLPLGKGLERRALVWVVLGKSLIFAILLLAFHIAEEAIRAWFEGQPLSASLADFGGSLPGLVTYAAIFFVALIPFFAFQEAARVLGGGALWNLFFRGGEVRFRLIED
jgi:hypothetical protein